MVVLLTERLSVVVEVRSAEWLLAVLADKAVRVPGRAEGIDTVALDGLVARGTTLSKDRVEVLLAVGPAVTFKELTTGERLETLRANEMVNVPFLSNRGDTSIEDGEVAVCAFGRVLLRETFLAIGSSIFFRETTGTERSSATGANKTGCMEGVTSGRDHLADD